MVGAAFTLKGISKSAHFFGFGSGRGPALLRPLGGWRGTRDSRSRGTPRIANRLLRRVRDFAQVKSDGRIDGPIAARAMDMLDVDNEGVDFMDRKLLLAVIDKFMGGPVGLDNLAAAIGEEKDTIEDVLEPYLIQQGYLQRTPRGRIATPRAYVHFGLQRPDEQ